MPSPMLSRRSATAAVLALPALWTGVRAQPAATLRTTPSQIEGPFYPVRLPGDSDHDLLRNGALQYSAGQPVWLEGSVTDLQGRPVAGAQVEIWQCDQTGHYHHPGDGSKADPAFQGFGRVAVDAAGNYRFRTIRPVAYASRTPHIHVKVRLGGRALLTTQLYVQGDPHNARDALWRNLDAPSREAITVPFRPAGDGLQARFPIVVAA